MRIALVPVNVVLGDWEGNLKIHQTRVAEAVKLGADLVVFPELSLVGYCPLDMLARPAWAEKAMAQLDRFQDWLAAEHPKLAVIVGTTFTVRAESLTPRGIANCAVFLQGKKREVRAKTLLPDYDVFHEMRYFDSAVFLPDSFRAPIPFGGKKLGILICEDSWEETEIRGQRIYRLNPTEHLAKQGCDLLVNISASPFDRSKRERRREAIGARAKQFKIPIVYVNHYGANDDLLFDGDCFRIDENGEAGPGKLDADGEILLVDLARPLRGHTDKPAAKEKRVSRNELRGLEHMLVMGIRDYCRKNGFERAVLGISGGIDSALVAALACEALGAANVTGLIMPSKFSSLHSIEDAEALARAAGFAFRHAPIKMTHSTFLMGLKPFFEGMPEDVTEENMQSRIRGMTVMAFANKFQALALATGNRSEFSMGYSTLYGDMCGALAPIGDLLKTEVYELARYMNSVRPWIPERTFTKPPSAELRPNQTDQDTLPPYDVLDACLRILLEQELEPEAALAQLKKSFPKANLALVERVQRSLRLSEYKRRQAPPILKVSPRAFGPGRVYPITCQF
jgi:NAD+ synthase (glutamine-hydrolysing)